VRNDRASGMAVDKGPAARGEGKWTVRGGTASAAVLYWLTEETFGRFGGGVDRPELAGGGKSPNDCRRRKQEHFRAVPRTAVRRSRPCWAVPSFVPSNSRLHLKQHGRDVRRFSNVRGRIPARRRRSSSFVVENLGVHSAARVYQQRNLPRIEGLRGKEGGAW
jgi:hypothetical protein